jgi:hypothetical protein
MQAQTSKLWLAQSRPCVHLGKMLRRKGLADYDSFGLVSDSGGGRNAVTAAITAMTHVNYLKVMEEAASLGAWGLR